MATPGRPEDFDVVRWPISGMLDSEPYRFEFFQAVRLLSRMYPTAAWLDASTTHRRKWYASARIRMRRSPPARFKPWTAHRRRP